MWQKILTSIGLEAINRLGSFILEWISNWKAQKEQTKKEEVDAKIKDLELKIAAASLAKDTKLVIAYTLELNKLRIKSD